MKFVRTICIFMQADFHGRQKKAYKNVPVNFGNDKCMNKWYNSFILRNVGM